MTDATEITIRITTPEGASELPLGYEPISIGRTAGVAVVIPTDKGLSRRHLTLRRMGAGVHAEDEHTTNGSLFRGQRIGGGGVVLADGDEIEIGNATTVRVRIRQAASRPVATNSAAIPPTPAAPPQSPQSPVAPPAEPPPAQSPQISSALVYLIPGIAVALIVLCAVAFGLYKVKHGSSSTDAGRAESFDADSNGATTSAGGAKNNDAAPASSSSNASGVNSSSVAAGGAQSSAATTPAASTAAAPAAALPVFNTQPAETPPAAAKLYRNMTDAEKTEFIKQRAQHVAIMMGNRPYAFPPDALALIKKWVDAFDRRVNASGTGLWRGSTAAIVERGRGYAPTIIRAFQERNVPIVIGLYIPFIETEYNNIQSNNAAGAAGLFQFLGPTAEGYGVPASERTNVDKMSVAAAMYYRDNLQRFGSDPMGVALSVAGYNRAPESVLRDLRNVAAMGNNEEKERTFWSLVANKKSLDEKFQNENSEYVPRFFAAAVFGETPWAFGIQGRPLSTYTQPEQPVAATAPAANRSITK
jgi:pSer/pThr/pTyr-binding forkhead associated (FHA) protein